MDIGTVQGALLLLTVVVFVLGLFIVSLLFLLVGIARRITRQTVSQTENPFSKMVSQTAANVRLVDTPEGRDALTRYAVSEAAVSQFLSDIDNAARSSDLGPGPISPSSHDELRAFFAQTPTQPPKPGWIRSGAAWVKGNAGKIAEKLFGKVNDLVKGFVPGMGGSHDGDS